MKRARLLFALSVLIVILTAGLLLRQPLPETPPRASGAPFLVNGPADRQAGGLAEAAVARVPPTGLALASQLLTGLVCGFFILLGVFPIFLIDGDIDHDQAIHSQTLPGHR